VRLPVFFTRGIELIPVSSILVVHGATGNRMMARPGPVPLFILFFG